MMVWNWSHPVTNHCAVFLHPISLQTQGLLKVKTLSIRHLISLVHSVLCTSLSNLLHTGSDDATPSSHAQCPVWRPSPDLTLLNLTHCFWTFPKGRSVGQHRETSNYNYNHSHRALIRSTKAPCFVLILKRGNVILLHMKGQSKRKGKICSCLTILEEPFPLNFNLLMVPHWVLKDWNLLLNKSQGGMKV